MLAKYSKVTVEIRHDEMILFDTIDLTDYGRKATIASEEQHERDYDQWGAGGLGSERRMDVVQRKGARTTSVMVRTRRRRMSDSVVSFTGVNHIVWKTSNTSFCRAKRAPMFSCCSRRGAVF